MRHKSNFATYLMLFVYYLDDKALLKYHDAGMVIAVYGNR